MILMQTCLSADQMAHFYENGPSENYHFIETLIENLLLKTEHSHLQFMQQIACFLQLVQITFAHTYNFLKSSFEKYLALLVQAGVNKIHKKIHCGEKYEKLNSLPKRN